MSHLWRLAKKNLTKFLPVQTQTSGITNNFIFSETKAGPYTFLDFSKPETFSNCIVRTDREQHGYSTASLDYDEKSKSGHFHGNLSLDIPTQYLEENINLAYNPVVIRSGYVLFRTKNQNKNAFGPSYWDWNGVTHILLRVLGDSRKYFLNIQAESSSPLDLFQHRIFLQTPGKWETVTIPVNELVETIGGHIKHSGMIDKSRVKTIGIGLIERKAGPFSLYIKDIKLVNRKHLILLKKHEELIRQGQGDQLKEIQGSNKDEDTQPLVKKV